MMSNRPDEITVLTIILALFTVNAGFCQNSALGSNGRLPTIEESLQRHNIRLTKPALVAALRSPDAEVRWLAAQELANIGANDTIAPISRALHAETVPGTKVNIAYALAQLDEQTGVAALQNIC